LRKSEPKVVVVGAEELKTGGELPALIEGDHFAADLFGEEHTSGWLHLEFASASASDAKSGKADKITATDKSTKTGPDRQPTLESADARLKTGEVQAVLIFPDGFGKQLKELRATIKAHASGTNGNAAAPLPAPIEIPKPRIQYNAGKEKSRVAHMQVERVVATWRAQIQR
jgi:hypothetical protein